MRRTWFVCLLALTLLLSGCGAGQPAGPGYIDAGPVGTAAPDAQDFAFTVNGENVPQLPAGGEVPRQLDPGMVAAPTPPYLPTVVNAVITEEQAREIALSQVPGATVDNIREFDVDYDDGCLEYEGKILYGRMEYEFEIDGYSGAIRSWEVESIYD